MSSMTM